MTSKALIQATKDKKEASLIEVASVLGLSYRRIRQLCVAGILPKPLKKGKYDLTGCTVAYCAHQRGKLRTLYAKIQRKKTKKYKPIQKSNLSTGQLQEMFRREIEGITGNIIRAKEQKQKKPGIKINLDLSSLKRLS
jgi:hypothetical protein